MVRTTAKLFFLLILCIVPLQAYQYNVSICAIFQNEGPNLKEWIDYHRGVGVDHFYLYNNTSTDNYKEVLKPYVDRGIVEIINWPNKTPHISWNYGCQSSAYADVLIRCIFRTKWLCIIDLDEFLVPMHYKSLAKELKHYPEECVAIYANWITFGTSYVWLKPGEPMLPRLTLRTPIEHPNSHHGKTIVRPEFARGCVDPHFVVLYDGFKYYDGSRKEWGGGININNIRINHYTYRDESFLKGEKSARVRRWGFDPAILYQKNDEYCQEKDTFILSRIRQVK